MSRLDIITTHFNKISSLNKTIDSLRAQTFNDWQHYIIDAGTLKLRDELNQNHLNDRRVKIFIVEKIGIYEGMNFGIMKSKSNHFMILNSGTIYESKSSLETCINFLEYKKLLICDFNIKFSKKNIREYSPKIYCYPYGAAHESIFFPKVIDKTQIFHNTEKFYIGSDIVFCYEYGKSFEIKKCKKKIIIYDKGGYSDNYPLKKKILSNLKILILFLKNKDFVLVLFPFLRIFKDILLLSREHD